MERRAFLGTVGIALSAAVGGCTARGGEENGSEQTETGTMTDEDDNQTSGESPTQVSGSGTVSRTVSDGSLSEPGLRKPHRLQFKNATDDSQVGTLQIRGSDDETRFEEQFELASDASVSVILTALDRYEATISLASGTSKTVELGPELFDCNTTTTTAAIQSDGTLDVMTASTRMACPGVVTDTVPAGESRAERIGEDTTEDTSRKPHAVLLGNPTDETWTTRLRVADDERVRFDGVYTVEPEANVRVVLAEPAEYQLDASVLETGAEATESVGADQFDCNSSSTSVSVTDGGELKVASISTLMACVPPEEAGNETTDADNETVTDADN
ncbi:hypothetical protein GL213_02580 [Halogeometricum borinquense]|uniref:Uncharacterized protein n=1 Tax=Halogeometricum borinquense TaxID=60847 RepID=A0A6C0UKD8_9EURY|nr:hypothetical protein [Halogeometricum borinquense]QIB75904.1 hypothetical protein G3I44_17430 [Halogeometricum borinquense]QIQ75513.1 hypothetical protein GL213_02580 [Halogeometricum borinquense]